MNTKHFPLNLQSHSTLSKLWNFGGGGGLNLQPPPLGTPLGRADIRFWKQVVVASFKTYFLSKQGLL